MALYTIRKKIFYVARGYSVTDSTGAVAYRVNGRVRFARTFVVEGGRPSCSFGVREKLLTIDPTYIVTQQGKQVAKVCRTTSDQFPERYAIDLEAGESLSASGSPATGVTIRKRSAVCAKIWREQEKLRETFGLETTDCLSHALLLAIALAIVETDRTRGENPGL